MNFSPSFYRLIFGYDFPPTHHPHTQYSPQFFTLYNYQCKVSTTDSWDKREQQITSLINEKPRRALSQLISENCFTFAASCALSQSVYNFSQCSMTLNIAATTYTYVFGSCPLAWLITPHWHMRRDVHVDRSDLSGGDFLGAI